MKPETVRLIGLALLPLVLLAGLLVWIIRSGPAEAIRGEAPPVEVLRIERVELAPGEIIVSVLNDGPDPSTIAQVQVDDAYWGFTQEPRGELRHLGRARLRLAYPWVQGEVHVVRLVTSTGLTFDHEIPVAMATPRPSWRSLWVFALIGLYVGVIPVVLGLLWYPLAGRLGPRAMDFLLALTLGLLLFLLVDALHEGLEIAGELAQSFQGIALLAFGFGAAYLALEALGGWLSRRRSALGAGWVTALLLATGIGLHNFGEGLAIGAAIARQRVEVRRLALLGLIGGLPTIAGAWLGGFVYSPVWSVLFLGLGAGAIAQVIVQIARGVAGERPVAAYLRSGPVVAGFFTGFAVMYSTGMLIQ